MGLGDEGGGWKPPDALDLGAFAPHGEGRFVVGARPSLAGSRAASMASPSSPTRSRRGGQHGVVLPSYDVPTKTLISDSIEICSTAFARAIVVTGGTVGVEGIRPVSDLRLWG